MKDEVISVIMPAYNCAKFVEKAIESVLQQTHSNIELLVADDASTDNTRKVIDKYQDKRIKRFHQNKNLGYLFTCNRLFEKASGSFIAFQDADDYSSFNRLEKQLKFLLQNPQVGVCGTNLTAVSEKDKEMFCSRYETTHENILNFFTQREYTFLPNSFLLRRKVYNVIGGYNEYFSRIGAEDYYWTWLIMEQFQLANLPEPLYYYRYNPNSISGDLSDNYKKMFSSDIVQFLVKQRQENGTDDLEKKDTTRLDSFVNKKAQPYLNDTSLLYKQLVERCFWEKEYKKSLKYIPRMLLHAPLNLKNYRLSFFIIKSIILK